MQPFFFGSSQQQLFGIIYSPHLENDCGKGIVICQTVWQEYIRARHATCQIAQSLADAGFHTILFDYYSTGDSSGECGEATADRLSDDIKTAIDELCDSTGIVTFGLIGIRFGAALAARCCRNHGLNPFAAAFWDPVTSGADYIQQLKISKTSTGPDKTAKINSISGFPVTPEQISSIETVDEKKWFIDNADQFLALFSLSENKKMWEQVTSRQNEQNTRLLPGSDGGWCETDASGKVVIPKDVIREILSYFSRKDD